LEGQNVILDDRIGEEVFTDRLKLRARGGDIVTFQFQLDAFADVSLFDGGDAEVLDGAANRVTLGIEDAFAWADDDLGSNHDSPYRLRPDWKTFLKAIDWPQRNTVKTKRLRNTNASLKPF
jgi:hypothetical protein